MTGITGTISREQRQYQVYIGLTLAVLGLTGASSVTGHQPFARYIGSLDPRLAALLVAAMGGALLTALLSRGWFAIYKKENLKGLYRPAGLAAVLGAVMILVDLKIVLPADTNIPFPASLLFYPAIGFFVEIVFHVLPLTLLIVALTMLFRSVRQENIIWVSIFFVALLEPVYQVLWMGGRYPLWAVTYVGLHVLIINLLQLAIFRKYDFLSMYAFRIVYYLFWHIGWGHLRLNVLF